MDLETLHRLALQSYTEDDVLDLTAFAKACCAWQKEQDAHIASQLAQAKDTIQELSWDGALNRAEERIAELERENKELREILSGEPHH